MSNSPYTILIVEDFAADRELYRRSLLTAPNYTYRLLEAESLAQGRELCQLHQYDAVLLDYSLPDGDGLEFLGELSARYLNPPPVVILTGQGSESIAVRAIKLGAQDYLIKRDLTVELLQLTMQKAIENHRLRQQLQQIEDRFRISIDNMSDCVGLYSVMRAETRQIIDFRFDYLNPAALASNRMSSDDLGKSLCEMFPAFRTSGLFEEYCQLVTTGQPLIKEDLVYEDVFGGERLVKYYALHASLLNNDNFMVSWRDLTAQKQAESQLQAANQQIIDIWENMTDAYVSLDRDWLVIYANRAATQIICHLTNLAPAEFLGRSHWDLFPSLVGGDTERDYRRALTDGVTLHTEVWFEPTESWFEVHLYPAAEGIGIYFRDIGDRKRMEADRSAAEQERDRFFNLSIDLLAIGNFDGYFTRLNPAWEKVLGFTTAELMARPFFEFIHPDDLESTQTAVQRGLSEGWATANFENRYRCKDGSYRWLSWSTMPLPDFNLMYGIAHDITDRKQQEIALRESERKFSAIFEQSFELMGIVSLDGVLLEVNQTALDSISARKEDIAGKYFWDTPWWHTEQLQQQLQAAIAKAANGEFSRFEVQFPQPSGVILTTDFSLKPVFDETGSVVTIVAEAHDITDRKQAEAALRESEERFRNLADNMSQFAWMADADGGLFWYNRRWFDYTGTTLAEMQGWGWQQVHHPEHVDRVVELFRHHVEIGQEWEDTFPLRGRDGTYRWFLSRAIPIVDAAGQVLRWFGTNTDITEQQIALRELQQTLAALEARNQELDSFVHIVSHDLKAPLRAVSNLSIWIEEDLEGSLTASTQEQMNLLRGRIDRMSATIDGLLDYARIGRSEDSIEPVAVADLIAETIYTLAPPPTFTIAIAQNLPTLYTKRMLLSQVFTNLLGNAIKHHDRADGMIHLGIAERPECYEFAIADDGPGIDPANHDRVFRIFQAVNPQQRTDSTGIGLAIVKKIVEAEGGTLRLESQIGKGTTFYFTWPK